MSEITAKKKPTSVEPYYVCWCTKATGLNDGSTSDKGELQGATISTATWTIPTGITKDSSNQNAVTIQGVSYAANTVCTVWVSGGTDGTDYTLVCTITTSDARTLADSIVIPVRA